MDALSPIIAFAFAPFAKIRAAWLFGSQASGKARADSDLDIAVCFERALDADAREALRRQIVAALADALGALGERADIVDLDDCDSLVAFRAVSQGTLLLARTAADRVRTVARVARRHDDEAPRRELFRKAALAAAARLGAGDDRR